MRFPFRPEGCRGSRVKIWFCAARILCPQSAQLQDELLPPNRAGTDTWAPAASVLSIVASPVG